MVKYLALIRTNEADNSIGVGNSEVEAAENAFRACTEAIGQEMAAVHTRYGIQVMPLTDGMVNFDVDKAVTVQIDFVAPPAP